VANTRETVSPSCESDGLAVRGHVLCPTEPPPSQALIFRMPERPLDYAHAIPPERLLWEAPPEVDLRSWIVGVTTAGEQEPISLFRIAFIPELVELDVVVTSIANRGELLVVFAAHDVFGVAAMVHLRRCSSATSANMFITLEHTPADLPPQRRVQVIAIALLTAKRRDAFSVADLLEERDDTSTRRIIEPWNEV